ncbi:cupin domain-containing protein [Streptomyces sp. NBC_01320]|uniref:cupin domain-containing protein n=1 Tax=Streptomyces sp. NBC_01320 TaxID=2903824 RepID=UPI002E16564E|nr:cupin domain-containing protein [Streptomyces sp. NBC_01320]
MPSHRPSIDEANPTVDVLVRIADVLDTSCTDLLRQPLLRPEIIRASSLDEPDDETSVNLLFAGHELGRIEIYRTRLHPHAQSQFSSHGADSVEYVLVMSGQVTLVVDDIPHLLETGDTARFSGLSSHYYTTQDSPAVTHTIVGHPRDWPTPLPGPESISTQLPIDTDRSGHIGRTPVAV